VAGLRQAYPALRYGRQYLRQISFLGRPFDYYGPGEIVAWSRILDDEELLCVLNPHGTQPRGADVMVDASLNPPGSKLTVVLNSAQAGDPQGYQGTHPVGEALVVQQRDGAAYIELRDILPSEVVVLANYPLADEGSVVLG
jgi:hypothetical protein